MSDALVLGGWRTPRGRGSTKGALADVAPLALVTGLLERLRADGVEPRAVDDLVLGCAAQVDAQGANIARTAALVAGWEVPGLTVGRFCASGIDAVALAAARVRAGDASLVVAGGVESLSHVPLFADGGPLYADPAIVAALGSVHMGIAADLVASVEGFGRDALDAFALRTRDKARRAWAAGRMTSVAPVVVQGRVRLAHDELLDWTPTAADLAALPPAFAELGAAGQDALVHARHPDVVIAHRHTRASSPPLADAACVLVVGDRAAAERSGLEPRARIVASAVAEVDPVMMLTAGQLAVERVIARAGLRARDIDVFQFAEAFASVSLRFQRDLDADDERFNPDGGTLAMGHAFGATGAILSLAAVDHLHRRGGRYAVAAVSGAAGVGTALLFERVT
ncbi:MAG: acetyl-CoA C-acyltransferase [Deltaproteobacteria bacterium]|nr:acetyl-CoA C-acyltransferase [Deltaproteobacteria bacterium]